MARGVELSWRREWQASLMVVARCPRLAPSATNTVCVGVLMGGNWALGVPYSGILRVSVRTGWGLGNSVRTVQGFGVLQLP